MSNFPRFLNIYHFFSNFTTLPLDKVGGGVLLSYTKNLYGEMYEKNFNCVFSRMCVNNFF